jgi:hypothetical protein
MKSFLILSVVLMMPFFSQAVDDVVGTIKPADPAAIGANACAMDRERLCAGIEPGDRRLAKCMREKKDQVSAECKAQQKARKAQFKDVKEACHEDVEKFCGGKKGGRGRIMKCMRKHKDELSAACKAEIEEAKAMHQRKKK